MMFQQYILGPGFAFMQGFYLQSVVHLLVPSAV